MNSDQLLLHDHQYIWHPASQMKDYEIFKPLIITKAYGSYLELSDGKKVIDAISSWWCKSLGHNHPRLKKALLQQLDYFEHVLLANTTHETIVKLSAKLAGLLPSLNKCFYASDGACAIEIAMKMSLHARGIQGDSYRKHFIALVNGYHGETIGALSVSDVGLYRAPYQSVLFDTFFIPEIPYIENVNDPLWNDCSEQWDKIEKMLAPYAETCSALIVEPIVQGAGGMKIYSQDFLKRLRAWSLKHHIHLIADEIMTGICRTGKILACEYAHITPDFLCLSKGLTSGWIPFSVVLTTKNIYQNFYDDFSTGKSFLHSHTHSGNALAASIALEVLNIIEEQNLAEKANMLGKWMLNAMQEVADTTNQLINVRQIGAIVAADLIHNDATHRLGFEVYQKACSLGALLRPIGNTIYWLPPLTTTQDTIEELKHITLKALLSVKFN